VKTVAYDRELAALLGIDVERVTLVVFLVSGVVAGLAAVLVAVAFNVVDAQMGSSYGLIAMAITIIGGFGSIPGAMLAGLGVGLVSSMTTAYITTAYRDVVVFGVMLLVLFIRPRGLVAIPSLEQRA
jgi:branched-chain amino acid transport system permease protein